MIRWSKLFAMLQNLVRNNPLFTNERFVERSKAVTQPLKKNNLLTFTSTNKKTVSKDKTEVEVLKDNCASFFRLYIACQTRDGNAEDFFKYENQP